MVDPAPPSSQYRPAGRPQLATDAAILTTADELFRQGTWPSADALRARLGTGSKSTIHRVQKQWRETLAHRFTAKGPAALERLPEPVAHVAEALWIHAQEEARRAAHAEQRGAREGIDREQDQLALQRHVLSLREQEMQRQLQDRERASQVLEAQLREQTLLLRKLTASRDADARHIRELQSQLEAVRQRPRRRPPVPARPKRSPVKRKTRPAKTRVRVGKRKKSRR